MSTTASVPATAVAATQKKHPPTRRLFTVEEYCTMADAGILSEDERVELLDGEIVVMPPIGEPHEDSTDRLNGDLSYVLRGRARVRVQNSVRLDDYGLPEPDIAVVRLRDDYHRDRPTAADVLLLVEVADTSLEFDREVKLARYAAAGIPEVWIANLRARQVEAHSDPVDGSYRSRRVVTANGKIGPLAFPDVSLAVADFLLE
ncbi:MAG: Uma2 family endonuclease [Chloroflexi bacterium]|nr:Uma2 family endonuclease [Chloroflexota bacterium]